MSHKDGSPIAELLMTANQLIRYGYNTKTALPLLQAVEIYNRLGVTSVDDDYYIPICSNDTVHRIASTDSSTVVQFETSKIMVDAAKFADGNKHLLALMRSLGPTKGRVAGPKRIDSREHIDLGYDFYMTFRGGEQAFVVVSGYGDSSLELYIYDTNGNCITSDTDDDDSCCCVFTPQWTGKYLVKIRCNGKKYFDYVLYTN